ncbi:MAG: hypothetical protein M3R10_03305 [Verrucomicrobiota bacterium]|nr:hypothetical protein [Verrucomicrobiota bacterium]
MKSRFALLLLLCAFAVSAQAAQSEYIVLVGGPSLHQWEQYKAQPHDHWWANFVHSARVRTEQLRAQYGPDQMITWLVYKPGYVDRGVQEHQDLIANINSIRDKFHLHLVYFTKGADVIAYLNHGQPRNQVKVCGFEYFGHSNRACFLFDYSNVIDSASKAWLHETELREVNPHDFVRNAYVKSWGCHTGESMSKLWRDATGTRMWGAIGKTDYSTGELPALSSAGGHWVD